MNRKKLAIVGILALVVIGCVVAAGCTSTSTTPATTTSTTTTTSTDDAVVGTWTLPNGTTVVFGNDFNGVMTTGDNKTNFTWKKTTDGKYQVDNEKGEQVIWTLDNVKGTMTNAAGMVLTKQASNTSGAVFPQVSDVDGAVARGEQDKVSDMRPTKASDVRTAEQRMNE